MSPASGLAVAETARVLVVGCGNISGGFDIGRDGQEWPFSHAGAYRRDGRFHITACVEPDDARRDAYMQHWQVPTSYRSIEEAAPGQFDVVSICSPSRFHANDLDVALALQPKLIFCEKPVTTSLADTERAVRACADAGVLLAVNYSRRFDPRVATLHAQLTDGAWGDLRSVTGTYNKGILNNGSHMIDLLDRLLGELKIVAVGKPVFDYFPDDPAVPVWLESEGGVPVQLACGHAADYSLFELQFVFARAVVTMEDGGLYWRVRRAEDSRVFPGYRVLDAGERDTGAYPQTMLNAVNNVHEAIYLGRPLASSGDSALVTQRICETIRRRACATEI